jgi:hypothetical protein
MPKMMSAKTLLLGTAAGFMAVAGAQAADMPVKAKPVQYVKICTLYGDGYYYIPGSDTCIKIGGFVRMETGWNTVGGDQDPAFTGTQGAQDRSVSPWSTRARAGVIMDTRTETQYGTLRTLTSLLYQNQNQTESFNAQRAFLQWSGFTFGRVQSFSDVWSLNDSWNLEKQMTGKDTGSTGVNEIAYTFDLGSGVALTFGADERATKSLTNLSVNSALKVGAEPTDYHQGEVWPDLFVNLRTDQSWGYFAVSATAHNVDATYYTQSGTSASLATSGVPGYSCTAAGFAGGVGAANTPLSSCGHPSDKVGWAVNAGGEVRIPMGGGLTDRIGAAGRVAVGATSFTNTNVASPALFGAGNNLGVGWMTDGVYVNGSGIELTTSWGVQAGYEHAFTNTFRGDLVAGYGSFSYDSQAQTYFSDALGCTATGSGAAKQTSVNVNSGTNCSPNYQFLEAGVRGTWTPIPNLYFSAQLTYYYVWTALNGDNLNLTNAGANPVSGDRPSGIYSTGNQNIFSFITRVQRSFNVSDN